MINKSPINQMKLFGLNKYFEELAFLYEKNELPNKILLSGKRGLGKCTLTYHFINYVLSKNEDSEYNFNEKTINSQNHSFKTIYNKSNPNLTLIDLNSDKKFIDINQIRELISNLNKSSFNAKPRFVLIDNIEFLNLNSINALLKILEEPSSNVYFFLINHNKKILPTLLSRCLNFKITLTHNESLSIANDLLDGSLKNVVNPDLINYYISPGNIYNLVNFSIENDYNLFDLNLRGFLKILINNNHYKKDDFIKYLIFDLIEFYFIKINSSFSIEIYNKYRYFLKRISDTKRFNLDEDSFFQEFDNKILNG